MQSNDTVKRLAIFFASALTSACSNNAKDLNDNINLVSAKSAVGIVNQQAPKNNPLITSRDTFKILERISKIEFSNINLPTGYDTEEGEKLTSKIKNTVALLLIRLDLDDKNIKFDVLYDDSKDGVVEVNGTNPDNPDATKPFNFFRILIKPELIGQEITLDQLSKLSFENENNEWSKQDRVKYKNTLARVARAEQLIKQAGYKPKGHDKAAFDPTPVP